eukprot:gb/GECG01005150.1/.p1 GENE.gb/GECG01005150.1/~~gb/GECG01005150.1/.p1  ORF type:complete len:130 (+),score=17.16 gb/GECG01005150.1/:1-390(+)
MSSNHLKLQVDIVSDIVCPWCYVGYRRFFKGWEQLRKENQDLLDRTQLNLRWQPFQLDPTMPKEGVKTKDALRKKFGPERMHALQQHLQEAGREENIDFKVCTETDLSGGRLCVRVFHRLSPMVRSAVG